MFCSEACKKEHARIANEKTIVHTYRTSAKQTSSLENFYRELAKKENFCVICGKEIKSQEKNVDISKIAGVVFMFASIVPGTLLAITSKPLRPVISSLLKKVEPNH